MFIQDQGWSWQVQTSAMLGWLARECYCFGNEPGHSPGFNTHTVNTHWQCTHKNIHGRRRQREVSGRMLTNVIRIISSSGWVYRIAEPQQSSLLTLLSLSHHTCEQEWYLGQTLITSKPWQAKIKIIEDKNVTLRICTNSITCSENTTSELWALAGCLLSQYGVRCTTGHHLEKCTLPTNT